MTRDNTLDTREVMTGKDGKLMVSAGGVNVFLAEVDTWKVNMTVNSVTKQPVGSILVHSIPTGVAFALSFTEMVIRDDVIMEPLMTAIHNGSLPDFNFQGVCQKPDGTEQRMAFDNAVPNGEFDLMSVNPGEVIERQQNFALNKIPRYLSTIASTYLDGSST